jgi:hypothetical protein
MATFAGSSRSLRAGAPDRAGALLHAPARGGEREERREKPKACEQAH